MSLGVIILTEAGASCTFCRLLEAENTISSRDVESYSRLTITSWLFLVISTLTALKPSIEISIVNGELV